MQQARAAVRHAFQTSRWKSKAFQPRAREPARRALSRIDAARRHGGGRPARSRLGATRRPACRQRLQGVGLSRPACPSRQRSMRGKRTAMPHLWRGCALDALEAELEHQRRLHAAHRAELLDAWSCGSIASTSRDLLVGEARVGLGERHAACARPLSAGLVPDREGVVGVEAGAPAVAALRVDQHGIDAVAGRSSTSTRCRRPWCGRRRSAHRAA